MIEIMVSLDVMLYTEQENLNMMYKKFSYFQIFNKTRFSYEEGTVLHFN
jgi:hypothetical protein